MILSCVAIVLTILYWRFVDAVPPGWEKGKFVKLLLLLEAVSLGLGAYEEYGPRTDASAIVRNEAGAGSSSESRILTVEGLPEDYEFSVDVPERVLTGEEIDEAFSKAEAEIDASFIGDNASAEEIEGAVNMASSYVDGIIGASWHLSDYTYIQTDGTVFNETLKEPVILTAEVTLTYREEERIYSFPFRIVPQTKTPVETFLQGVKDEAAEEFADKSTETELSLPSEYGGRSLIWSVEKSHTGIKILLLGILVLVGLGFGQVMDEKKKEEERIRLLELEYSDVVCTLSLLLGSGMSIRRAWEKMVASYGGGEKGRNEAMEEMTITLRHMQDGMSEAVAIEEFGRRCRLPCYKKMSGLLVQFIQKGAHGVRENLAAEVRLAFEERKSLAKIAGEQAGTKLLGPMIIQLGTTLVIIIVPALMAFSF